MMIVRPAALPIAPGRARMLLVLAGPLVVLVFAFLLALGMPCGRGVTVLLGTGRLGGSAVLHAVSPWWWDQRSGLASRRGTMQSPSLDRCDACVRCTA